MRTLCALSAVFFLAGCNRPTVPQSEPETAAPPAAPAPTNALLAPQAGVETAPAQFKVLLATTKGDIHIEVNRAWAPNGADRFYNLVKRGYYDGIPFFRVMPGFMAQTGIHNDPRVNAAWREARIPDDPVKQSNRPGMLTFATSGVNSRSAHFFINVGDNAGLDPMGFSPFGRVTSGLEVAQALYPTGDSTVDQYRANMEGAAYFKTFPQLDYIKSARLE